MYSNIATNAIILNNKNEVLLTLRQDMDIWCLPGGMVEAGESISESIIRELKEEIKLEARIDEFIGLYSEPNIRIIPPSKRYIIVAVFKCSIEAFPKTSDEVKAVDYFSIENLPNNIIEQHKLRIIDSFTKKTPIIS